MYKKIIATILTLLIIVGNTAFAAEFPHEVWEPLDRFAQAFDAGNTHEIYSVGKQLIEIMEPEPESQTKTEFLSGKYYQVAEAADKLGYYEDAINNYVKYIPYGKKMNQTDGVLFAEKKIKVLQPRLNLYFKDSGASRPKTYFGAKFEPESGVLFGSVYDNDSRILSYDENAIKKYFPKENAMNLVYLEFGEDITALGRYEKYFKEIRDSDAVVMLAWNTYSSLGDIANYSDYIRKTIDYLGNSGLKIILRFGNEMNVAENGNNPDDYIKSFRYVADIAHKKNNIAMCWAPNDVGALDRPFETYYPGDAYVDWIGVSLYTSKYFEGKNTGDKESMAISDTYFLTGTYADPVIKLSGIVEFMKENNISKPLAITECGVPYVTDNTEYCSAWGVNKLYKIYGELTRVYPQLKAICYFNVERVDENQCFALFKNSDLNIAYNEAVKDEIFITEPDGKVDFSYNSKLPAMVEGGILEISASAYYPLLEQGKLVYYLDGKIMGECLNAPYSFMLDCSKLSAGTHKLEAKLVNLANYELLSYTHEFKVEKKIKVFIDGEELVFTDCNPVLSNDRTLVPLRAIFEALKATVDWDNDTETVTSVKDDITVKMTIGKNEFYVNGEQKWLDVPPQLINDRTLVPVRAIAESFKCKVDWDDNTQSVLIKTR